MARITLRQLLDHAAEHGYGVPAFNINNMEQGLAIMEAAAATDAPVCWLARVFDLDPADSGGMK
jgi:fructose-bisphosphate aldolase class II